MADIVIRLGQIPTTITPATYNSNGKPTIEVEVHKSSTLNPPEIIELPAGVTELRRTSEVPNVTLITLMLGAGARSGPLTIKATRMEGHPELTGEKTSSGWIEVMS